MDKLILHYAPDNASLIIRLVLEELGLPYETRLVDRMSSAQDSPAYRKINPAGHIPALETQDGPISETAAILLWLVDRTGRMGSDSQSSERGAFLKWLFFLSNTLQAGLRLTFYPKTYIGAVEKDQARLRSHMQTVLPGHLTLLETELGAGHSWFGGKEVSVVDYYTACCLRWCALYPAMNTSWYRLADYPKLQDLLQRLETRDAVIAAQSAEGLGPLPFSAPVLPKPPEGSAL